MGGPIFGASGKINLAYFDALKSMSQMSRVANVKDSFSSTASTLKSSILAHLWNEETGIMRMSDTVSPTGICQDINAYAITTGIAPYVQCPSLFNALFHSNLSNRIHSQYELNLAAPASAELPLAFQNIERWDQKKVVSPYSTGFAAEALFERNCGASAIELIERVWGIMADETGPDYSGGHWEAMKSDGTPITDDTSLMHGWSTWPVYLLPRYLGGVEPLEAGWSRFKVKPVLAGLTSVEVELSTRAGTISLSIQENRNTGELSILVPCETTAEIYAPDGWTIVTSEPGALPRQCHIVAGQGQIVVFRINRNSRSADRSTLSSAEKDIVETKSEEESVSSSICGMPWLLRFPVIE
jgi:hypothetical protein